MRCGIFFFCIFQIISLKATIFDMEEFYNPRLNQSIILMGDYHSQILPDIDKIQLDDIMQAMVEYNPYILIEDEEDNTKGTLLLDLVHQSCKAEQLSYACIDFRKWTGFLLSCHESVIKKLSSIEAIMQDWSQEINKKYIVHSFGASCVESWNILEKLIAYQQKLRIDQIFNHHCKHDEMIRLLNRVHCLAGKISVMSRAMITLFPDNKDNIPFIVENSFGQDGTKVKENSLYKILFDIASDIFDLHILAEIYKKRDNRIIFVIAGRKHTNEVGKFLVELGYISKNKILNNDHQYVNTIDEIIRNGESLEQFKGSWANVESFFKRCSSLKFESTLRFKVGFFVGGATVGCLAILGVMLHNINV